MPANMNYTKKEKSAAPEWDGRAHTIDENIAYLERFVMALPDSDNRRPGLYLALAMLYTEKAKQEARPFCNDGYELKPFDWKADLEGRCNDPALLAHRAKYCNGGQRK